ncbi:MAG: hypothetical protein AAF585_21785, partial [Verrucomicrobiota bacterium]
NVYSPGVVVVAVSVFSDDVASHDSLDFIEPGFTWLNQGMVNLYDAGDFAKPQFYEISGRDSAEESQLAKAAQTNREIQKQLSGRGSEWYRVKLPDANRGGFSR